MKSMYTDTGRFPWRLCVVFIRPSATAAIRTVVVHCQSPVGLYTYLYIYIYCVSVYVGLWMCLCAMLAPGVSFFRNRIRNDVVLHPARPVPVVFHYLISSSASAYPSSNHDSERLMYYIYICFQYAQFCSWEEGLGQYIRRILAESECIQICQYLSCIFVLKISAPYKFS